MNLTWLKELFAGFLRTRHIGRHFRRLILLDTLIQTGVSREVPAALAHTLFTAAENDPNALLKTLDSHLDGLTEKQADAVRQRVGPNEIGHEKPLSWWMHLWHCYRTPFNLLLTLLAGVSYWTEDLKATAVISSMVVLATLIRFWQERKSNRAARSTEGHGQQHRHRPAS